MAAEVEQQEKGERSAWWAHNVELITAVLALIALVISIVYGLNRNDAANGATDQVAVSESRIRALTNQLGAEKAATDLAEERANAAEAKVTELQKKIDEGGATSDGGTTSPEDSGAADPGVFHKGPLAIGDGQSADLDSPPDDPRWGTISSQRTTSAELTWSQNYRTLYNSANMVIMKPGTTAVDCPTAIGLTSENIKFTRLRQGLQICVLTNDARYSLLTLTSFPKDLASAKFQVTTLKKDGD